MKRRDYILILIVLAGLLYVAASTAEHRYCKGLASAQSVDFAVQARMYSLCTEGIYK